MWFFSWYLKAAFLFLIVKIKTAIIFWNITAFSVPKARKYLSNLQILPLNQCVYNFKMHLYLWYVHSNQSKMTCVNYRAVIIIFFHLSKIVQDKVLILLIWHSSSDFPQTSSKINIDTSSYFSSISIQFIFCVSGVTNTLQRQGTLKNTNFSLSPQLAKAH